jgi:hypothetical protein
MYVSPEENLRICYTCGEIFDANVAFEVLHHEKVVHDALLPPRRSLRRPQRVMMLARAC